MSFMTQERAAVGQGAEVVDGGMPGAAAVPAIRASSANRRAVPESGANTSWSTFTATSRPRVSIGGVVDDAHAAAGNLVPEDVPPTAVGGVSAGPVRPGSKPESEDRGGETGRASQVVSHQATSVNSVR